MTRGDLAAALIQAKTLEYRIGKLQEQKDLPPIVGLHVQATKIQIEKLVQAIHEGR